ncbi:hydrogenase maturation protease [Streptomyces sp. NPDC055632]
MIPLVPGAPRTLVAGVGNIFLGDDGFGVETVRALPREDLPPSVEVADVGIRGVHLAYQLLDGWDTLVLVDVTARGGEPGTLYLIDASEPAGRDTAPQAPPLDGHRMTPDAVLALLDTLCAGTGAAPPRRILLVGCEPDCLDEGIGLSPRVAAAVPGAVRMVTDLVREEAATEEAAVEEAAARETVAREAVARETVAEEATVRSTTRRAP